MVVTCSGIISLTIKKSHHGAYQCNYNKNNNIIVQLPAARFLFSSSEGMCCPLSGLNDGNQVTMCHLYYLHASLFTLDSLMCN